MENLHKETFEEQLNTKFQLIHEDTPVLELELIKVDGPGRSEYQERFSLTFRGPLEVRFGQGMQKITHESLGTLDLFFVPIAQKPEGIHYEVVFNRLIK